MLRDHATVEDLAQETFVRVFSNLAGFGADGRLNLSAWILTIAARLAIDELRRRASRPQALDAKVLRLPSAVCADGEAMRRGLGAAIERAVDALAPEYRAAFLLRKCTASRVRGHRRARSGSISGRSGIFRLSRARAALAGGAGGAL